MTVLLFWGGLFATLAGPLFFPKLPVLYFAPYLVSCFYRFSRVHLLWRAILCGCLMDLVSSSIPFGLTSLTYFFVCLILYGQKRNFFQDKLFTLALLTFFFSLLNTVIGLILSLLFDHQLHLNFRWWLTDFFLMAFLDAGYAFACYSLPHKLLSKGLSIRRERRRQG